jgi:Ca-activated chloride channel family protein
VDLSFRDASALVLLAAIPFALLFLALRERTRDATARRIVSERLRGGGNPLRVLRPWFLAAGLLFAVVALAGPWAGFVTVPVAGREANRIVVIDVSNSMAAQDVAPSRLGAAKALASRLLAAHPGRTGLVIFEARPDVIAPLTNDTDAVIALLGSVAAGDVGEPGSDIGSAVLGALRLLESESPASGDVVVISDGEDQGSRLREALARAKEKNVRIHTILVGRADGATIPGPDGPLRDESGRVVTTSASGESLEALASSTGGRFLDNPFTEGALEPLVAASARGILQPRQVRIPIDRYQWPLALAFVALTLGSIANRGAE